MKASKPDISDSERWAQFAATRDPGVRQELILRNVHLVKYVIDRVGFQGSAFDTEDLTSEGIIGLIDAVDRFDPKRGIQFVTYATIRIRGQILDALRTRDLLSRSARRRVKELRQAITTLTGKMGAAPTEEQLAQYLGVSVDQVRQSLMDANLDVCSLDAPLLGHEENLSLKSLIEAPEESQPVRHQEQREVRNQVRVALRKLPRRQQILLSLYYFEELTMKEIGRVLGVSESRVSQLHAQAVLNLRALLESGGEAAQVPEAAAQVAADRSSKTKHSLLSTPLA